MADSLLALRRRLDVTPDTDLHARPHITPLSPSERIHITRIAFHNIKKGDARMARKKCRLAEHSDISLAQIEQARSLLRTASIYTNVSFHLAPDSAGYALHYQADEHYEKTVNLGAWFDADEIATLLVNGRLHFDTRVPTLLEATARLAKRYGGRLILTAEPTPMRRISLSYDYLHNDFNMNRNGKRLFNTLYDSHRIGIELSDAWFRNVRYAVGARFEYFHFKEFLTETPAYTLDRRNPHYANYFARFDYDSFDRSYYPTRGGHAELGVTAYTDNFISFNGKTPALTVHGNIEVAIPLGSRLTLIPAVTGRAIVGETLPFMYANVFGYPTHGRYLDQQIAFNGLNNVELAERYFGVIRLKFQQRIGRRHYVSIAGNYGMSSNELIKIFNSRQLAGLWLRQLHRAARSLPRLFQQVARRFALHQLRHSVLSD